MADHRIPGQASEHKDISGGDRGPESALPEVRSKDRGRESALPEVSSEDRGRESALPEVSSEDRGRESALPEVSSKDNAARRLTLKIANAEKKSVVRGVGGEVGEVYLEYRIVLLMTRKC